VEVGDDETVEFVGFETLSTQAKIIKYRSIKDKKSNQFQLVLNQTPFYAESGGQVGDTGTLTSGAETIKVLDTKKENDLIIHLTDKLPENTGETFFCQVDPEKRKLTKNNHSATHLLQAALKNVLGEHVQQKGSLVNENMLRFDFSHFAKLSEAELQEVEVLVNDKIRQNIKLEEKRNVPIDEAKGMGATALFGEKYGDFVRVITFDPRFSVELCGGTHVNATGEIGYFKIISEGSIAAGVRRIEAKTAKKAEEYVREQLQLIEEVQLVLKSPRDLKKAIESLIAEKASLKKEVESLQVRETEQIKESLKNQAKSFNGYHLILGLVKLPHAEALKKLSFELKNEMKGIVAVLAADIGGKPQIAIVIDEAIVEEKGLNAGLLVRELAKEINGGGGGQPFYATAGGKDSSGLPNVLKKAEAILKLSVK